MSLLYLRDANGNFVPVPALKGNAYVLTDADKQEIAEQAADMVGVPTKADIGLGNVDNVKQYSASNPPPYPVTSVQGRKGDVYLKLIDLGLEAEAWEFELEDGTTVQKAVAIYTSASEPTE